MSKNEPRTDSILVIAKMCVKSSGLPIKYLMGRSIASWIITQKTNAKTVYKKALIILIIFVSSDFLFVVV